MKFEDVLGLLIFLFSAILTSYLAAALRGQIREGRQKERNAHLLYQLAQALNRQDTLEKQLALFARYFEEVFSALGLQECSFLLPDTPDRFTIVASRTNTSKQSHSLPDEESAHIWVHQYRRSITLYEPHMLKPHRRTVPPKLRDRLTFKQQQIYTSFCTRLIPLQIDGIVKGILRLHLAVSTPDTHEQFWSETNNPSSAPQVFFSTLLEHAITVIQQEQLRQGRVQLQIVQQTEKLRSALLTSVSHDLRRPLTTIKAATESLRHQPLTRSEIEQSFLDTIERESDWLDSLIENLLDMSRIEAGALQPQTVWYELDVLIYDVLLRMQAYLQQREIKVELPEKIPLVAIDVVLIDQVLTNLLTNAVSYTQPESAITIQLLVEEFHLLIRIIDRGIGIHETEQEHIFEKFYRLNPTINENISGLGLGLAICRAIVEAHQGRIWVETNPDGGAIFAFTIPYASLEGNLIDE